MTFRSVLVTRSYEQVIEQIHDGIRAGALTPGQRLPTERELGESFGVSRGVVREALKVLASMGLVESRQGSGNYISANSIPSITKALTFTATPERESLQALFEVREPLEALATRLATARRTPEQAARIIEAAEQTQQAAETNDLVLFSAGDQTLHGTICEAARNPYLTTIVSGIRELLLQTLHLVVEITGTMTEAAAQHRRIAAAIEAEDAEAAAALMAAHVRYNANALREIIASGHDLSIGRGTTQREALR